MGGPVMGDRVPTSFPGSSADPKPQPRPTWAETLQGEPLTPGCLSLPQFTHPNTLEVPDQSPGMGKRRRRGGRRRTQPGPEVRPWEPVCAGGVVVSVAALHGSRPPRAVAVGAPGAQRVLVQSVGSVGNKAAAGTEAQRGRPQLRAHSTPTEGLEAPPSPLLCTVSHCCPGARDCGAFSLWAK